MSTATFTPAQARPASGSTASGAGTTPDRHIVGNTLRALKVFAGAAISVVILGEFNDGLSDGLDDQK